MSTKTDSTDYWNEKAKGTPFEGLGHVLKDIPAPSTPDNELDQIKNDLAKSFASWGQMPPEQFLGTTITSATLAADMIISRVLAYADKENRAYVQERETAARFNELCTAYTQVVGHTMVENPKMSKSKFVSRFTKYLHKRGGELSHKTNGGQDDE